MKVQDILTEQITNVIQQIIQYVEISEDDLNYMDQEDFLEVLNDNFDLTDRFAIEQIEEFMEFGGIVTEVVDIGSRKVLFFPNHDKIYNNGYLEDVLSFIYDLDMDDLMEITGYDVDQFNDEFWGSVGPGSMVWHNTTDSAWEDIQEDGILETRNETRGLANRFVGNAVFVTTDPDETALGSYGNVILEIDLFKMKRDNFTPMIQQEEPWVEFELRQAVANLFGRTEDIDFEHPDISPNTLVIFSDIPIKYIERND